MRNRGDGIRTSKSDEGRDFLYIVQPPCQSGVWKSLGTTNGTYTNLGSHSGSFSGSNNGTGTLFVYASG
ncbi:prepilin, shufflon protein A, partial [Salmonella enterica subsp. enterica serovar Anatum]|nr:prepilin, shufflon protein A [Salmonella enterica subsp. enterica serovar Anatum]